MEVLISVIILAMSMAIVFYVIQSVQDTQCVSELKGHTLALQNALLDVALGSPPTTRKVFYKMPACGGKTVEVLRFSYYADPNFCRTCPGAFGGCWIIEPVVYDYSLQRMYRLADALTCVNMPADVELAIDPDSNKCLTDRLSPNFCPRFQPGSPTQFAFACNSANAEKTGVTPQIFYSGNTPRTDPQTGTILARSMTFVKKPGEKTFYFQLTKEAGAGNTGSVKVCPLKPPT